MSPESQRIAIAEACGFEVTRIEYDGDGKIYRVWATPPDSWAGKDVRPWLPDFLNDLNAMHEAVKSLPQNITPRYFACLCNVVSGALSLYGYSKATEATAAQRAEAFLKTLDKWIDDN